VNAVPPRTFKFGDKADRARESRSKDRDTHQRQNRDASQNRSRNILDDDDVQMMDHQLYRHLHHHRQTSNHNLSLQILIWKKQKDSGDPKQIILFRQSVHSNNHNNNSKTDPLTTTNPTRANNVFQITNPGNLHNPQGDISKVTMGTILSHLEGHKPHMKTEPGAHQLAASLLQEVNLGKPDFKNQTTPLSPRVAKST
jgi:hypothetical protein